MIRNILNTIGSRLIMAFISLSLLLLNAKLLGAEGLGTIGLLILGISLFILINNFVNGGGLIYYASRFPMIRLLKVSYAWTFILAGIYALSISLFPTFLENYAWDLLFLGIILAISTTNSNLLLGKEQVKQFNFCLVTQSIVQLASLLYFYFILKQISVDSFILATYLGYSSQFLLSSYFLKPYLKSESSPNYKKGFVELFQYGFYLQLANIFQLLNYRLSYYILQIYSGRAAVGVYTAGVQLSEGILLPSKSLAMVQYARISNLQSEEKAAQLSIRLMKLCFIITLPLIVLLLLIPTELFSSLLGADFKSIKPVILLMSVGIISLSMEAIISRFFSGMGMQKINSINAGFGLVLTLGFGFWLIPLYGLNGAAITASITYFFMFTFILYILKRKVKLRFKEMLFSSDDFQFFKQMVKDFKEKRK